MINNPNDSALEKRIEVLEQLLRANPFESASFGSGGIRVYDGGTIRFTEGGGIVIEGDGYIIIGGDLTGDGTFRWTGPWSFNNGDGEIAGNVNMAGDFDLTGKLTAGNVRIEDGKIYVGTGGNLIVIDGETGKILAGNIEIDPSENGGSIKVGEHSIYVNGAAFTMVHSGGAQVVLNSSGVSLVGGGKSLVLQTGGASLSGLPVATSAAGMDWLAVDSSGILWRVPPGIGGPIGGPLEWPFPASSVTSEYGPRDGRLHAGIDFGQAEGAPIPAAASGTVIEAVTLHEGWGNYVKIDHGDGIETLYAHMVNPPPVTVGQHVASGQVIGNVGNTGNSFGAHLHFEVYVDGSTVNPRTKLPN